MPVALTTPLERPAPQQPPRKRWTSAECAVYEDSGMWAGQHYELIEGELIDKMSKKQPHTHALKRIMRWLNEVFEWAFQEAPINVAPEDNPTSEPEPDAIALKPEFGGVRPELPKPNELALAVEVADTTLTFDLTVKAGLYARAGIADYWVLDLDGRRMIVHREPEAGVYKSVVEYAEIESVAPLAAPEQSLAVRDVLV